MRRPGALALGAWVAIGCGPSPESQDRDRVLRALEAVRAIPAMDHESRASAADELAKVELSTPTAIEARDTCSRGYRLLAEASALTASAESSMRDTSERTDPRRLAQLLSRSEELLLDAEPMVEKCNDAATKLATGP